jgi:hypothetical protein
MTPADRSSRARLAAQKRHHPHSEQTQTLAAEYATDSLARHIAKVVAAAPPLSDAQISRLALLLSPAI